jgi:hypothetical protein
MADRLAGMAGRRQADPADGTADQAVLAVHRAAACMAAPHVADRVAAPVADQGAECKVAATAVAVALWAR